MATKIKSVEIMFINMIGDIFKHSIQRNMKIKMFMNIKGEVK